MQPKQRLEFPQATCSSNMTVTSIGIRDSKSMTLQSRAIVYEFNWRKTINELRLTIYASSKFQNVDCIYGYRNWNYMKHDASVDYDNRTSSVSGESFFGNI